MEFINRYGFILGLIIGAFLAALIMAFRRPLEHGVDFILSLFPVAFRRLLQYPKWRRQYCEMVNRDHRYLRFVGVRHPTSLRRPQLKDVYINLELQTSSWVAKSDATARTLGLGEVYGLHLALNKFRHLAILGTPGSGKTTLLEHLACVTSDTSRQDTAALLPIFVPLRRCTFRGKSLVEQLTDPSTGLIAPELLRTYPPGFFESLLSKGKCLLLLDGLDEVLSEDEHVAAARMVETTSALYPECPILVTSRLAGWRDLLGPHFARLVIRELSRAEIAGLVRQWHHAVVRAEMLSATNQPLTDAQEERAVGAAHDQAERMLDVLNRASRLMQIANTPLILSLMCLVFYTRKDLPRRRAKLYEECAAILLEEWDHRDKQLHYAGMPILEEKVKLLEAIALHLFDNHVAEASRHEVERVLSSLLTAIGSSIAAPAMLRFIEERSGLLSEKALGLYGFTHLTFQEYFAAKAITRMPDGLITLRRHFNTSEAEEVLLLYAGLLPDATELVSSLFTCYEERNDVRLVVVAGRAIPEAQHTDLDVETQVKERLTALFDGATDPTQMGKLQAILSELGVERQVIRSFGDYDVADELGRGGMGTVYRAFDRAMGIRVALKVFNSRTEDVVEAILKGLKQLQSLDHPNLIRLLAIGKQRDQLFVAMELVDGLALDAYLSAVGEDSSGTIGVELFRFLSYQGERLTTGTELYYAWVKTVLKDTMSGLAYLHEHHIIHGDIKPSNILWDGQRAKLGDYGLDSLVLNAIRERSHQSPSLLTRTAHFLVGTPDYMAPERMEDRLGVASDIFSLGRTLEFLCGLQLRKQQQTLSAVPGMRQLPLSFDAARVAAKATSQDPNDRYESVAEMRAALELAKLDPRPELTRRAATRG
jgi:energy-coupling factor transporter ATP-binding protein EcfA2